MQTILLIRHAKALERDQWHEADRLRPLNKAGRRQAEAIARMLEKVKLAQIRTSPATRCVQTVEPLAKATNTPLTLDEKLLEGSRIRLPQPSQTGVHVLCAHGDNIPWLLDELEIDWRQQCKKGSIWQIERDDEGGIIDARYEMVEG